MPIETYNNVRGFTFIQSTEPSTPKYLDSWFNTSNDIIKIYDSTKWVNFTSFHPYAGSQFGYVMGGDLNSVHFSLTDRIQFPFDSGTALHVGNLTIAVREMAGCNSSNYGYTMGGYDDSVSRSIIGRITFPFDSGTATHTGDLSGIRRNNTGCDGTDFVMLF